VRSVDARLADLPRGAFRKADETDDGLFYQPLRLVTHIDDAAVAALTALYDKILPRDGDILDLMSSWVSHLPPDLPARSVVGHGMNADELAANPRLSHSFVQDLNRDPILPLPDGSIDAALCCVGVQYLQDPVRVFADVARVLRPGAPVIVSFSNRCFATKAVAIWQALDMAGRARLVRLYLERSGFEDIEAHELRDGRTSDPLIALVGRRASAGQSAPTPEV
jgi:SAM-dependent methyltransferase